MSDAWKQFGNPLSQSPAAMEPVSAVVVRRTSSLAIVSALTGMLAAFMVCIIFLAAPLALAAIATGHLAVGGIRRSAGKLTGVIPAAIGLVLGYGALVGSVGLTAMWFMLPTPSRIAERPGAAELRMAASAIGTDREGHALGNSAAARRLAERFATAMETLDEKVFTQTNAKIKLSGGHYVTWCELHEGKCAFVVHVPEYRRFTSDAKKLLEELAWATAQKVALGELVPGDELAVGLKGVVFYGSVTVGKLVEEDAEQGVHLRGTDGDALIPFFVKPAEAAADSPSDTP